MKLGVTIFATDYAMRPDDLAKACEERGFESVWFPEHTHIPTSLRTPPPIGTKVPRYLYHLHDLFVNADRCRRRYEDDQDRQRHLSGGRARSDYPCQRSSFSGPALERTLAVWHWRRVERRGNGESRDTVSAALASVTGTD